MSNFKYCGTAKTDYISKLWKYYIEKAVKR